jgi:hypothetical protein
MSNQLAVSMAWSWPRRGCRAGRIRFTISARLVKWLLGEGLHRTVWPGRLTNAVSCRSLGMAAEPQDGDGEDWAALATDRRPQ